VDYALALTASFDDGVLSREDRMAIDRRLREGGGYHGPVPMFPGRRKLASALRRAWKAIRVPNEGWSVSDAGIGNRD
jgi:hypothetical protein